MVPTEARGISMSQASILTAMQIAAELKCSDKTVRRHYSEGLLPGAWQTKKGSSIKIAAVDVAMVKKGSH